MPNSYSNPVYPGYFADPFVFKHESDYYAYGTGSNVGDQPASDGRYFPILASPDLVHWQPLGGALVPPSGGHAFWAPEVAARDGRFYLYYSAAGTGGDETHRLRVAVADHPAGPFLDSGKLLLPDEGFTIDAHPFRDPRDGRWYLFFAKDFFDACPGTALAVVPLAEDMVSVAGPVTAVLRASGDWQVYERDRTLYGQQWDAWHTLEGPFVRFHDGRYFCFYSGGAWTGPGYGVGVAVADTVLGPYAEPTPGPCVLRGVPDHVIGPGHNSLVRGPDGETDFVVYHAWDTAHTARRLCIDPLRWTPNGPRCAGPTWTPQNLP